MEHDYKKYPVESEQQRDPVTGNYMFDAPQSIHFSYIGGKYRLSFSEAFFEEKKEQKVKEKNELARDSASLDRELFMIGHIRDVRGGNTISETDAQKFDTLVTLLAKQDFD